MSLTGRYGSQRAPPGGIVFTGCEMQSAAPPGSPAGASRTAMPIRAAARSWSTASG